MLTYSFLFFLLLQVLRRGAHVDDKDSLTDLSLLHFACKAGALVNGGSPLNLVSSLIAKVISFLLSFMCYSVVFFLYQRELILMLDVTGRI